MVVMVLSAMEEADVFYKLIISVQPFVRHRFLAAIVYTVSAKYYFNNYFYGFNNV